MPRIKAGRQNVTISISPETVRKARILAARRSTSISGLLAEEIESRRSLGAFRALGTGPAGARLSPRRTDHRHPGGVA
jgi:hypothetical protein